MALVEVLDGIRRIIHKWVHTVSPLASNLQAGDTQIYVQNTRRFEPGNQIMLKNSEVYETGLVIASVDSENHILNLVSPVLNNWDVGPNTVVIKTLNEQFVQGIYVGDPDVIMKYPAITVMGNSRSSEWMTLEGTKERYEIEVGIYVQASAHEKGYRYLLNMADTVQKGLKRNIMPLIDDYDIISLSENASKGDINIKVTEREKLENNYGRLVLEDTENNQETWVQNLFNGDSETVNLRHPLVHDFSKGTSIIIPHRHVYNSWPATIDYGKVHKGELLKAATISWFAEEEEMQWTRRDEKYLR